MHSNKLAHCAASAVLASFCMSVSRQLAMAVLTTEMASTHRSLSNWIWRQLCETFGCFNFHLGSHVFPITLWSAAKKPQVLGKCKRIRQMFCILSEPEKRSEAVRRSETTSSIQGRAIKFHWAQVSLGRVGGTASHSEFMANKMQT